MRKVNATTVVFELDELDGYIPKELDEMKLVKLFAPDEGIYREFQLSYEQAEIYIRIHNPHWSRKNDIAPVEITVVLKTYPQDFAELVTQSLNTLRQATEDGLFDELVNAIHMTRFLETWVEKIVKRILVEQNK